MLCACRPQVWVARDAERLRQAGAEGGALPHSFHYQSGALGSGLLLLSRYPITEVGALGAGTVWFSCNRWLKGQRAMAPSLPTRGCTKRPGLLLVVPACLPSHPASLACRRPAALQVAFHPYSARGDPAAVLQGDFLVGKGVGWAALATPAGTLSVFCTHLSANCE